MKLSLQHYMTHNDNILPHHILSPAVLHTCGVGVVPADALSTMGAKALAGK